MQFSRNKLIQKIMEARITRPEFVRLVVKAAPAELRPSGAYVYRVLGGSISNPGSEYLSVFAKVFGCSRDDFFEEGIQ